MMLVVKPKSESGIKARNTEIGIVRIGTIADGRPYSLSGTPLYLLTSQKYHNPSRHLTILFNTYTFFQIFNFLCSRKIQNELSVF